MKSLAIVDVGPAGDSLAGMVDAKEQGPQDHERAERDAAIHAG